MVLLGVDVPVILRKTNKTFQVVGEAYVDGIMHGEAVEQWHLGTKEIRNLALS